MAALAIWRAHFQNLWVTFVGGAAGAACVLLALQLGTYGLAVLLLPLLLAFILHFAYRNATGRVSDQLHHLAEVNRLHLSTIEALAHAIDAKDAVTHGHIRRVQGWAMALLIQPQLPSVVASAASVTAALFKPGQVLEALVVGKTPEGLTTLKIGDVVITAKLPQTLPPGTTLQLQVKAAGPAPQLVIVGTPRLPANAPPLPATPVLPLAVAGETPEAQAPQVASGAPVARTPSPAQVTTPQVTVAQGAPLPGPPVASVQTAPPGPAAPAAPSPDSTTAASAWRACPSPTACWSCSPGSSLAGSAPGSPCGATWPASSPSKP